MLSESSCNEHQNLRYLAKSIHGVNEGSATEVDRYQMSEMGLSIALEMVRSPKLARLSYRTAEEPWLPDGWACRVAQGRIRPRKMTWNNLLNVLCLWGHRKDSQMPYPWNFPVSADQTSWVMPGPVLGALGCLVHRKAHGNVVMVSETP